MPKKRVGVSLRQSSPPPDAAADASETAVSAEVGEPESRELPSSSPVQRVATAAQELSNVDAFVNGAALALERAASEIPAAKLEELRRRGPEGFRELTIYLPEDLAQKLSVHCLQHNLDLSRLVVAALEQHLSASWTREPARDARGSERALSTAARALLVELAAWVRLAWTTGRRHWPARASAATSS
jgi:hypothetical protein